MNIPKNVQEYISSLPPNQQKAAINEIMRSQYSAYKNSPNQVNQQNMAKPIITKNQELTLPSKFTEEENQEQGNLEMDLQSMLVQYFEKMQFTEAQAKQFMQEFAKLSDEEKQQVVQELQQELQGNTEEQQEMPEEEMQEPQQQQQMEQQQGQTMKTGGFRNYMSKKKKYQVAGETGIFDTEESRKKYIDSNFTNLNNNKKETLPNPEPVKMSYVAPNLNVGVPTSNESQISVNNTPTTNTATNAPANRKQVVILDNKYYEVDVDNNNKPIFNTARVLTDTDKANMSDRYVFETPTSTTNPTISTQTNSGTINERMNTNAGGAYGTNTNNPKVATNPKTQATAPKKLAASISDNDKLKVNKGLTRDNIKSLQSLINIYLPENTPLNEDGVIGQKTIAAAKQAYPKMEKNIQGIMKEYFPDLATNNIQQPVPKSSITTDTSGVKPDSSKMSRDTIPVIAKPTPLPTPTNVNIAKQAIANGDAEAPKPGESWDEWLDRQQSRAGWASLGMIVGGGATAATGVGAIPGAAIATAGEILGVVNGLTSLGRAAYAKYTPDKEDDKRISEYLWSGAGQILPSVLSRGAKMASKAYTTYKIPKLEKPTIEVYETNPNKVSIKGRIEERYEPSEVKYFREQAEKQASAQRGSMASKSNNDKLKTDFKVAKVKKIEAPKPVPPNNPKPNKPTPKPTTPNMAKKIKANNSTKKQFGGNLGYWF